MEFKNIETQTTTEVNIPKLIKIDSYANVTFDRYYFEPESKSILTVRNGKRGEIRKQIKPTNAYGKKYIVVLRDSNNNPRTIDYTNLMKYCENLAC